MLGKLFNLTAGTAGGSNSQEGTPPIRPSPESVQEEIHTRSLLFPDTQALYYRQDQVFPLPSAPGVQSGASANPFDYDGDIDIDVRDVRVIIMQDTLGSVSPSLLFDSQPAPSAGSPVDRPQPPSATSSSQSLMQDLRRVPTSPRKGSLGQSSSSRPLVIQPGSPQPRHGAFDRRGSIQSRTYSAVETESQKATREYREELASFSSCIFANSEVMSYKGTSTKVHIIPSEPRPPAVSSSYMGDGRGSMGRSSMRSSRLAQSFTSESANTQFQSFSAPPRQQDRNKILVTRLFPVNLPNDDPDSPNQTSTPGGRFSEDSGGFPFPYSPDDSKPTKKKSKPVQKRTPMYAVALVLQLPPCASSVAPATMPKPVFRGPSSYTEQDPFPSSYGSARRSGWTMIGAGFGSESFESTYSNDVEDRMDAITQHWDIIMRTLTHLQSVVATTLTPMLRQADLSAPDPYPSSISAHMARNSSVKGRRGSDASQMKPSKTNAKLVALPPSCLAQDQRISQEIEDATIRIVSGLRASRVVTGQGRWGPWREEARWVAKWAGSKEQGFFFFNLMTAFLATHTEWLQALSPVWYRRKRYQQQKVKNEEDTSLPSRTIIVAKDKMAARRLVFLLSAFLPANQQLPTVRAQRPATSASVAAFGHSPPSYIVPINKEESLRRKINRRQGPRGASHTRSFSIQSQATTRSATGIPAQLAHLSMESSNHERRSSDFIKPANLPIAGNDINTRKSSAATANTVVPDSAVPHFSTMHRNGTSRGARPNSSSSFAADDLKRSLKRGDSISHASHASTDSRQSSRWGSVISGLWSTRRRDSTATTSQTLDMPGHNDSPLSSPTKVVAGGRDKLAEMVREVEPLDTSAGQQVDGNRASLQQPDTPRRLENRQFEPQPRTPDPLGAYESPVKTSINNDDGVIDVDVQFPDYLTSFETAVSSPSSSGYLSTPGLGSGLDGFEQFSRLAIDGDVPLNVAGWLKRFHPDFTLQAIPPQKSLLDEVRESLAAEPTPIVHLSSIPEEWPTEHWVDVSTAIIADTTNFSIKRLRYRRLVKPKMPVDKNNGSYLTPYGSSLMTPAISPYEQPIKDKIEEEDLFTFDEALVDAVERVIAHDSSASKGSSTASSRSASKLRGRRDSEVSQMTEQETQACQIDFHEVPRSECKTVVLSALSSIVQEVVDERERENHEANPNTPYKIIRERESILRTAARTWLESVELTDR
ncbi:folliculin-interacting protein N-terminus-domain-containing protein [Hypoxylon trugodes]|uniref:folliculin-interacting protein N-terminus-domain-containing protein n=1 Tax=Hypoxylon trugodes TaxID=326681 RepID=UPI0021A0EDED|nr:folliculin-interacting protein N-terminus-domain-containing protein [Hypoxylon trugodes]KAI1382632.1 folliculin-interacting protein N-terminus-domain-containing protein [Hypoxylon trugodes]